MTIIYLFEKICQNARINSYMLVQINADMSISVPKRIDKFWTREIPIRFLLLQKTTSRFLQGINNFIIMHKTYFIQLFLRRTWIFWKI